MTLFDAIRTEFVPEYYTKIPHGNPRGQVIPIAVYHEAVAIDHGNTLAVYRISRSESNRLREVLYHYDAGEHTINDGDFVRTISLRPKVTVDLTDPKSIDHFKQLISQGVTE